MTRHDAWKTSPHASEFLPDEIDGLERGTMQLCDKCQWPRPVNGSCRNCRTCRVDRRRDGPDDFVDLP